MTNETLVPQDDEGNPLAPDISQVLQESDIEDGAQEQISFTSADYKLGKTDDVYIDLNKNKLKDAKELSHLEKMKVAAEEFKIKIRPNPKSNCRKCYGRGYTAIDTETHTPVPCSCMFYPQTEAEKRQSDMTPSVRMNRNMRRRLAKLSKSALKSNKTINTKVEEKEVENGTN